MLRFIRYCNVIIVFLHKKNRVLIATSDVSGCITLSVYRSRQTCGGCAEGLILLILFMLAYCSSLVCRWAKGALKKVNRSDIIGIRSSVIVGIPVVVRIGRIGR
jgi:hypothetical protein